MSKHTAGPWKWADDEGGIFGGIYIDKGVEHTRYQVYPFYDQDRTQSQNGKRHEADKRLIAAAPELLEACELAEATVMRLAKQHGPFNSAQGTLDVVRAAIAKAKGGAE